MKLEIICWQNKIKTGNKRNLKMKKFENSKMIKAKTFLIILTIAILSSCQDLAVIELSNVNTLSSIECIVVIDKKMDANGSKTEDVRQSFPGSISDNGIVTFSGMNVLTDAQKLQARFVAIVPLTATIVEKDGAGNIINNGVGGLRSITKKTYYFYVVAANGDEKKYVLTFN
jgi:hypothetical protein